MKHQFKILTLLAAISQALPVWGASGTEGASFLDIPVGAGPAALGSAYTALATNAYAPVWNPAGLGMLNGNELAGQHLSYLESMHYEYMSFVHPFDKSEGSDVRRGIGFSVQYLGSGNIAGTDDTGASIGDFSSSYASYNLSYGQTVTDKLALGITGKTIRAKIDDVSAAAYAADVAGLYKMNEHVQVAGSVVNVGSKLKFLSEGDSLPAAFKLGAAIRPSSHYLLSAEGVYRQNGLASFHTGGEWRPLEAISLRVGYKTDTLKGLSPVAGLTAGLGLHAWGQEFAYAWAPYGDLGDAQYFSLLIRFGAEAEEKKNLIQYQTIKSHRSVRHNSQRGTSSSYNDRGSNGKKRRSSDELDPEYQQLMQLLSETDAHVARSSSGSRSTNNR